LRPMKVLSSIFLEQLTKTTNSVSHDTWSPDRNSKPTFLQYEAWVVFLVHFI
jgi:multisubunit Na+/H+ antiporter MnhE subunit